MHKANMLARHNVQRKLVRAAREDVVDIRRATQAMNLRRTATQLEQPNVDSGASEGLYGGARGTNFRPANKKFMTASGMLTCEQVCDVEGAVGIARDRKNGLDIQRVAKCDMLHHISRSALSKLD